MRISRHGSSFDEMVEVILVGGPFKSPKHARIPSAARRDRKVKIPYLGGYEHFELTAAQDGSDKAVFEWTMRTKVAE